MRNVTRRLFVFLITACAPPARAEEPFDYFANSWGLIGLKDYQDGTRITPNNEFLLAGKTIHESNWNLNPKQTARVTLRVPFTPIPCLARVGTEDDAALWLQRTTDNWPTPPAVCHTYVGLTGDPWHLNVLGIELRPVRVEKVVFRDLGTPASPVLVAVTLEK